MLQSNGGTIEKDENETFYNTRNDPLYPTEKAANYIGKKRATLDVWRCTKKHDLKPKKIRGRIYYPKSALDEFLLEDLRPE